MMTVNVVSVSSGKVLGTLALDGDSVKGSNPSATKIFNSLKRAYETPPTDAAILDIFAGGWSNGYVKTVKA
jgi:hypothetical protein